MSDLKTDGLEATTATVDKKVEKINAKRENAAKGAKVLLGGFTPSENLVKVLTSGVVEAWNVDKENQEHVDQKAAAKEALIEAFGGSENLKAYCKDELKTDVENLRSFSDVTSVLSNIHHFYGRAKKPGKGKKAMHTITINNELYKVNTAYLASLADKPREEKIELVLAHADTVKEEIVSL